MSTRAMRYVLLKYTILLLTMLPAHLQCTEPIPSRSPFVDLCDAPSMSR